MKLLTIGTDIKLFEKDSAVLQRIKTYAPHLSELHIVVHTVRDQKFSQYTEGNITVYPTNSLSRWFFVWDAFGIGKKILKEHPFERGDGVITAQDPFETGLSAFFLARKYKLPIQLQIHTDFLSPYFKDSILNRIRSMIASFIVPRVDGLRVVSNTIKESIEQKFYNIKIPIDLLPIFVNVAKIQASPVERDIKIDFPQFKFIVFMASRLTVEKGIDVALLAFREVLRNFPYAGLVIAGDGPERAYLEKSAIDLGVQNNVVFIGWQKDLISYYKTADLFLITSYYEGYGMTVIEASAGGCPIVTTRVGVIKDMLFLNESNSAICPIGDVDCLASKIIELISDTAKRQLFKEQIQASIKDVSVTEEEYSSRYLALLQKIAKSSY